MMIFHWVKLYIGPSVQKPTYGSDKNICGQITTLHFTWGVIFGVVITNQNYHIKETGIFNH